MLYCVTYTCTENHMNLTQLNRNRKLWKMHLPISFSFCLHSSLLSSGSQDVAVKKAELLAKHLQEIHNQAVDHRYMHEYGETTPVKPSKEGIDSVSEKTARTSSGEKRTTPSSVAATKGSQEDSGSMAATIATTRVSTTSGTSQREEHARNKEEKQTLKHSEFNQKPGGETGEVQRSATRHDATKQSLDELRRDAHQQPVKVNLMDNKSSYPSGRVLRIVFLKKLSYFVSSYAYSILPFLVDIQLFTWLSLQSKLPESGPRINAKSISEALHREQNYEG